VDASTTRLPLLSRRARFASGRFGGLPPAARAVAGLPETTVTAGGNGDIPPRPRHGDAGRQPASQRRWLAPAATERLQQRKYEESKGVGQPRPRAEENAAPARAPASPTGQAQGWTARHSIHRPGGTVFHFPSGLD